MVPRITPKDKPKWHDIRRRTAAVLISIARKLAPRSPEVMAFYMEQIYDMAITGKTIVRVSPEEIMKQKGGEDE